MRKLMLKEEEGRNKGEERGKLSTWICQLTPYQKSLKKSSHFLADAQLLISFGEM